MKIYLPNLTTLFGIIALVLLGEAGQNKVIQEVNVLVNELISGLIVVFVGITVGLFIKNFIHIILGSLLLASFLLACIHFHFFESVKNEMIIAVLIVVLGFASVANLHNIQKLKNS